MFSVSPIQQIPQLPNNNHTSLLTHRSSLRAPKIEDIELILKDKGLKKIPPTPFNKTHSHQSLKKIDLSHNLITDLSGLESLSGDTLTIIDISHNSLTTSGIRTTLLSLHNLEILNLSNNRITELPSDSPLPFITTLVSLNLSHNELTTLPLSIFQSWAMKGPLKLLDISHNLISELPSLSIISNSNSNSNSNYNSNYNSNNSIDWLGKIIDISNNPLLSAPNCWNEVPQVSQDLFLNITQEVYKGIWVGGALAISNRPALKRIGVTHILNLAVRTPKEWLYETDFQYLMISMKDNPSEKLLSVLQKSFEFIEKAKAGGGNVLLACVGGISRSGAIAVAWIMKDRNCDVNEALKIAQKSRNVIQPNPGFLEQLQQFKSSLSSTPPSLTV